MPEERDGDGRPSTDSGNQRSLRSRKDILSRRRFLGGVGASVITSAGIAAGSDDYVEIVVARDHDGPTRTELVPEAWRRHVLNLRESLNRLKGTVGNEDGVMSIKDRPLDEKIGGLRKFGVQISVKGDPKGRNFPEKVNGIPIDVKRYRQGVPLLGCVNNQDYSDIPGATIVRGFADQSAYGTIYAPVRYGNKDPTGDHFHATAHHVLDPDDDCSTTGEAWQIDDRIGTVYEENADADWAIIDRDYGGDPFDDTLLHPANGRMCIDGWFVQSGVEYLAGKEDETVTKIGVATGVTKGHVISANEWMDSLYCTDHEHIVTTSANGAHGDSGAAVFQINNEGEAVLVNMISQTGPGSAINDVSTCENRTIYDTTRGLAQWALAEEYSIKPVKECL